MTKSKVIYQEPQMEMLMLSNSNIYTDIVGASTVPGMDENYGSDYDNMFGGN